MAQQRPLQRAGGGFPVARGPVPGGAQVMGFALAHDGRVQLREDLAGRGDPRGRRPVQLEVGAVNMAEHQAVVGGDRRIGVGQRVAGQPGQVLDRLVEQGYRIGAAGPHGNPPAIRELLGHLGSSCRLGGGPASLSDLLLRPGITGHIRYRSMRAEPPSFGST